MVTPPPIEISSLGMADSLILMVLALVVFGPRRLPQIGRQIGKLMYEFRKASNDFKFQMEEELRNSEESDRRKQEEERLRALAASAPVAATSETPAYPSESRTGAPGIEATTVTTMIETPNQSPYPGEDQYPAGTPAESTPEEAYPRIQPPATGEPVEAERPSIRTTEASTEPTVTNEPSPATSADAGSVDESDATPMSNAVPDEPHAEQTNPVTEQVNHG